MKIQTKFSKESSEVRRRLPVLPLLQRRRRCSGRSAGSCCTVTGRGLRPCANGKQYFVIRKKIPNSLSVFSAVSLRLSLDLCLAFSVSLSMYLQLPPSFCLSVCVRERERERLFRDYLRIITFVIVFALMRTHRQALGPCLFRHSETVDTTRF